MAKRVGIAMQKGFSLIEVMIALAIFSFFATAMLGELSYNVSSSMQMAKDLDLHNLAEMKMSEVLIGKKEFTNATENDPDTGKFELEGYEAYKYKVEITKLKLPELQQIMGKSEDEESSATDAIQNLIFKKLQKNIEEMIWQVKVTVTNTDTDYSYELNSWINKSNAKIDTNFSF
ncbi:MAG: prepilin-type N-terminal cleavage/methylation domain-containing protein [Halobacteriovoraceae bacterium]|jgi:prepilin-type N-terminal cleavage/methylation domain-containing protein|nr:prepilin-type N-terminal cleavage/methylation domain-containing protein [Halobacteriovoraceae bacterium]